ncbi:SMAD/FHA domain-containing protein, partial [Polychaeton citri CBS 116435]
MAGDTLTPSGFNRSSNPAQTNGSDGSAGRGNQQTPTIRFIPHIETRSTRPSLNFTALTRTLKTPTSIVKVGRYSERDSNNVHSTTSDDTTVPVIGFKSKVVSRRHCEFWCTNGQWYVKDVKSSSGTFLNHVRLSAPGQESRPYPVNDGDVVQLGIDFKGGEEMIFRCVKIRIECNRGWQKRRNQFNTSTHRKLLKQQQQQPKPKAGRDSDAASVNTSECSICLNVVAPCQALFVAPCSHVWHYKCIRGLIHSPNYPNFLCPNCRFVADLEADVEQPEE